MRCLYNSQGKHIAIEEEGELYDKDGIHIGQAATTPSTIVDEEIMFCGRDGLYLGEIIRGYQDRLFRMTKPGERRRFSVGYLKKDNISVVACPAVNHVDLPEGYEDLA